MSEPTPASHDRHDLELVARLAAGDLATGGEMTARDLLATCDACAALAEELRAIARATRELGSAAVRAAAGVSAASPIAPRDFRLTAADAARLSRRGFPGRVGVSAWPAGLARGVGGALATLGLVGLLLSAGLPAFTGGAASAPTREELGSGGSVDGASPVPAAWPFATDLYTLASSSQPPRTSDAPGDGTSPQPTPWRVATIVSLVALASGLALLLKGRRRHGTGP